MSKGKKNSSPPVDPESQGTMASGFQPYPSSGQFPLIAQQNFWENGNFMIPGVSSPLMAADVLARFPQLAELLAGKSPSSAGNSGQAPGMYGLPPSFGKSNPEGVMEGSKKESNRYSWSRA